MKEFVLHLDMKEESNFHLRNLVAPIILRCFNFAYIGGRAQSLIPRNYEEGVTFDLTGRKIRTQRATEISLSLIKMAGG